MIEAYPLEWPAGRKRTQYPAKSRFDRSLTNGKAQDELNDALFRLKAKSIVVSTNMPTKKDSGFYSSAKEPFDSGVAVYFLYKGVQKCFSCDKYKTVKENVWAIAKTIEAIRGIERWGTGEMVDAAFSGFNALPSPDQVIKRVWFEVLHVDPDCDYETVKNSYRKLASIYHPDKGGDIEKFHEISRAWEEYSRK